MRALYTLLMAALLTLTISRAHAHPLAPAALILREQRAEHYALEFRRPLKAASNLTPLLPKTCAASPEQSRIHADELVSTRHLHCVRPLAGQRVAIAGLSENSAGVVHIAYESGESARALLTHRDDSFVVPARTSQWQVLRAYGELGARHMLSGYDHLLFTTGLLLLGQLARVLVLLTAFTLGHSLTLALVALTPVALPSALVELGIALSLVALALAVLSHLAEVDQRQRPLWIAASLTLAVGLLHGLGFADGLRELQLPRHAVLSALFGFNAGVEIAQLSWVAVVTPGLLLLRKYKLQLHAQQALAYAIGCVAALWCIERALLMLG